MTAKGYVARGTDKRGNIVTGDGITTRGGCTDVAIFRVHDDGREERLPSYEEALDRLDRDDEHVKAIDHYREGLYRILRGEVDPIKIAGTYLGEDAPKSDALAALEAAERRLLEAGGWTPDAANEGRWIDPRFGHSHTRGNALDAARRLAAKGGA